MLDAIKMMQAGSDRGVQLDSVVLTIPDRYSLRANYTRKSLANMHAFVRPNRSRDPALVKWESQLIMCLYPLHGVRVPCGHNFLDDSAVRKLHRTRPPLHVPLDLLTSDFFYSSTVLWSNHPGQRWKNSETGGWWLCTRTGRSGRRTNDASRNQIRQGHMGKGARMLVMCE